MFAYLHLHVCFSFGLQKKIRVATDKLDDKEKKPIKKKAAVKPGKKGKGRAKTPVDTRTDEEREQDEIKERQRLEKLVTLRIIHFHNATI